jgi:metal-responsive CopG/Arc/MetJ family transcriptional regulator
MAKEKVYKKQNALSIDINLVELMDEYLKEIGYENRSKYIENLIFDDLEKRGKKINKEF